MRVDLKWTGSKVLWIYIRLLNLNFLLFRGGSNSFLKNILIFIWCFDCFWVLWYVRTSLLSLSPDLIFLEWFIWSRVRVLTLVCRVSPSLILCWGSNIFLWWRPTLVSRGSLSLILWPSISWLFLLVITSPFCSWTRCVNLSVRIFMFWEIRFTIIPSICWLRRHEIIELLKEWDIVRIDRLFSKILPNLNSSSFRTQWLA